GREPEGARSQKAPSTDGLPNGAASLPNDDVNHQERKRETEDHGERGTELSTERRNVAFDVNADIGKRYRIGRVRLTTTQRRPEANANRSNTSDRRRCGALHSRRSTLCNTES